MSITLTIVVSLSLLLILSGNVELNPGPKSADDVRKILKDVLRENFSDLSEAIKACVPRTAELMYSHKLISEFTRDSKDCWSMIDEFDKGMLFKENVSDLEGYCQSFLSCLSCQGGPPLVGAQKLAKEWSERVHEELNISLSFNIVMSDAVVTSQIPLNVQLGYKCENNSLGTDNIMLTTSQSSDKEVNTIEVTLSLNEEEEIKGNLINFNKKFRILQQELKNELRQAIIQGEIKLFDIIDSIQDLIEDIHNCDTIDNLLRNINNSFDFLDCRVIVEIAEEFASHNLASKFHDYLKEIEELRSSTFVGTLREQLHMIYKPHVHNPENAPKSRIDLHTVWDSVNIDRLYMLMRKFFSRRVSKSLLKNVEITSSSVHIVYYMSESQQEIEEIIEYCNQNISIMKYIGIYGIEIDGRVLLDGQHEDEHFTFEYGLFRAAEDGNNEALQFLIDLGIDVNYRCRTQGSKSERFTALMLASQNGHSETVERLLEKADPNTQNKRGFTALMLASKNGYSKTVKVLLEKADPNMQNKLGFTALMLASKNGQSEIVEQLLENVDSNIQNKHGFTALMLASENGHSQIVERLLEKVDPNIQEEDGWTALMLSSQNGHFKTVEQLLKKADPNIQNNHGFTALFVISVLSLEVLRYSQTDNNHIERLTLHRIPILELLLDANSSPVVVSLSDGNNLSSLTVAAFTNNLDVVNVLIQKVDFSEELLTHALITACYVGNPSVINVLLHKITDLHVPYKELLLSCVEGDLIAFISAICELDLNPNSPLVCGLTPLMVASSCRHVELIVVLIQIGADTNLPNDYGNGVLDMVDHQYIRKPNQEVISTLVKYGATHINPVNMNMYHLLPCNNQPTSDDSYTYEHQRQQPSLLSRLKAKYSPFAHLIPKAQEMNEESQLEINYEQY